MLPKKLYFRLEIERKNERIKELTETQNQLLAQVQEFEQENIQYITEINELKEKVDQLERKLAVLEDENSQLKNAAQMPLDISSPDPRCSAVSEGAKELLPEIRKRIDHARHN